MHWGTHTHNNQPTNNKSVDAQRTNGTTLGEWSGRTPTRTQTITSHHELPDRMSDGKEKKMKKKKGKRKATAALAMVWSSHPIRAHMFIQPIQSVSHLVGSKRNRIMIVIGITNNQQGKHMHKNWKEMQPFIRWLLPSCIRTRTHCLPPSSWQLLVVVQLESARLTRPQTHLEQCAPIDLWKSTG